MQRHAGPPRIRKNNLNTLPHQRFHQYLGTVDGLCVGLFFWSCGQCPGPLLAKTGNGCRDEAGRRTLLLDTERVELVQLESIQPTQRLREQLQQTFSPCLGRG